LEAGFMSMMRTEEVAVAELEIKSEEPPLSAG
jgi:hypothetical protein